jgi:hypothetical protein
LATRASQLRCWAQLRPVDLSSTVAVGLLTGIRSLLDYVDGGLAAAAAAPVPVVLLIRREVAWNEHGLRASLRQLPPTVALTAT